MHAKPVLIAAVSACMANAPILQAARHEVQVEDFVVY